MEDYTKKEIAELTSYYGVSEQVMDGLNNEYSEKEATWIVDFEGVAKAFFSSEFLNYFDWYDEDQVKTATNVLRNFYNYLLLHDVCPEYKKDLLAARKCVIPVILSGCVQTCADIETFSLLGYAMKQKTSS